ncbi:4a-hydroxytetrahydrobiopterin dehydratase [Psychrobacter sp. YP14]|jgi:4a-hydroxytetrahydrobiopterin dehydratase|uniref:Putative pterin-4-alpha-carbinolamine dehydratase n=3 Tax=Psychrobacter TaxID=497 RepID=A0A844M2J5_9GAMM|nr:MULTISPECIES: 4a-hydroxytetrahydrobiopterin dehydratase [Psychrobacter]AWT49944.1 4a-hydroxytetrahydrobiopterin dehydratase [Psychrobacter sp. YP14]MUG32747.1 4a-hydroxytetrahydrobiopterin dehydratase [Psychrobacter sanguinis]UNK05284.1 4a-hydroxytetrahydrobiopterin dehydratase [Psychrobacter sp. PraFG1]
MSHLTDSQVELQLQDLEGWVKEGNAIVKTFIFHDFVEAMSFMVQAAFRAQELEHHPEWTNIYNEVHVRLTTHDLNGISSHDIRLAKRMEQILQQKTF